MDATKSAPNDYLVYHQTVIPTQGVSHAIEGSFTLPNTHELILVRHHRLELWSLHPTVGSAECIHSMPLLCSVQAIVAVPTSAASSASTRATQSTERSSSSSSSVLGPDAASTAATVRRDAVHYIAMTTDLGFLTLLRYQLHEPPIISGGGGGVDDENSRGGAARRAEASATVVVTSLRGEFVKVSEQCLGRSGARLTVPGARLAVDSRGEALFISALMRNRIVVPLVQTGIDAQTLWQRASAASHVYGGRHGENHDSDASDDASDDGGSDDEGEGGDLLASGTSRAGYQQAKSKKRRLQRVLRQPRGVIELGSPLEVSRQTVVYSVCALEGFVDGCRFAALEEEIVEARTSAKDAVTASPTSGAFLKQPVTAESASTNSRSGAIATPEVRRKMVVVYAYNASVRHVQRTDLIYVPYTAHRLVTIPAEPCGPGGVLVCTDTDVTWYDLSSRQMERQQQQELQRRGGNTNNNGASSSSHPSSGVFKCSVPLPRRVDFLQTPYDPAIIQHAVARVAGSFFLLLQDELGDLFRVVLKTSSVLQAYDALRARQLVEEQRRLAQALPAGLAVLAGPVPAAPSAVVNPLEVYYFDTIPACSALALFRNGYMFAGAESAPLHALYKITRDGYSKESEYVVRRVQWFKQAPPVVKAESAATEAHAIVGVKRERAADSDGGAEANATASMLPPAPRAPAPAQAGGRALALYKPHPRCRHIAMLQTYPNTPAIVSFDAAVPATAAAGAAAAAAAGDHPDDPTEIDGTSAATAEAAASAGPQQVEFSAVVGRGGDSAFVHAQYGCATRLESVKELGNATFYALHLLVSADAVRHVVREQRALLAATTETDRALALATSTNAKAAAHTCRHQLQALRRLALHVAERCQCVGMDKALLSSAQSTAVYSVGRRVELETSLAFVTGDRTLAAATLEHGRGYVQITSKGVHLVPSLDASGSVAAAHWTHPHGKSISAAAANPFTFLVAFEGGGGIASFRLDQTGVALEQCGVLPSFPTTTAVAVMQTPLSALTDVTAFAARGQSGGHARAAGAGASSSSLSALVRELVAVATAQQQVFLFSSSRLAEPLERITCAGGVSGSVSDRASDPIVSLLLTFLSDESGHSRAGGQRAFSSPSSTSTAAAAAAAGGQLFCLVGYESGALTVCELDPQGAKVMRTTQLVCGRDPCQLIAGDAETHCYIRCGPQAWRCALENGAAKIVPWRFPAQQKAFAAFIQPRAASSILASGRDAHDRHEGVEAAIARIKGQHAEALNRAAAGSGTGSGVQVKAEAGEGDEAKRESSDNAEGQTAPEFVLSQQGTTVLRTEAVLALRDRQLALYVAAQPASSSAALEYSFDSYALPLAGRRILTHPTRPSIRIIVSSEHRGHGMADVAAYRTALTNAANNSNNNNAALTLSIAPNAPGRSPAKENHYASSVQLVDEAAHRLSQPYYLQQGEAALGAAIGAFAELGREPVLVLATADDYTHGAGCGTSPAWSRGWLRAFRFKRVPVSGDGPTARSGSSAYDAVSATNPRWTLRLDPLHSTPLRGEEAASTTTTAASASQAQSDIPTALHVCETVGLVMVGMGSAAAGLRLYVFGKQQFLRRRQLPHFPSPICAIETTFITPSTPMTSSTALTSSSHAGASQASGPYFASDLYQCPPDRPDMLRTAREKQLLIICATQSASVIVVSVQARQGNTTPTFLLQVARDRVQRSLTSLVMVDERTMAVADRFGHVTFLAIPTSTRFGFAEPISALYETELEESEAYMAREQHLAEVASHRVEGVVTSLTAVAVAAPVERGSAVSVPSSRSTVRTVFYATTLGGVGAFTPVLKEEDGAMAAHVWALLGEHARPVLQPSLLGGTVRGALPSAQQPSFAIARTAVPTHNVVDGDTLTLLKRKSAAVFRARDVEEVEDELEVKLRVERAQRERVLGLPPRPLPTLEQLVAQQRALATLPP